MPGHKRIGFGGYTDDCQLSGCKDSIHLKTIEFLMLVLVNIKAFGPTRGTTHLCNSVPVPARA